MARITYELVGSTYNSYDTKNKYKNEEVIKIDQIPLSSLEEIDRFTCQTSLFSINNRLPEHYHDKNQFSIRVTDKNHHRSYMRVIFDQPELVDVIDHLQIKDVLTNDGYRRYKLVPYFDPFVLDSIRPIEKAISEKNKKLLDQVVNPKTHFSWKIDRYFNSDYSEGGADEVVRSLRIEARNYSTFRSNFVYQMKQKQSVMPYQIYPSERYTQRLQINRNVQKIGTITFPEFKEEGYVQKQTDQFNHWSEKEEFLTPEEVDAAIGYNATYEQVRSQERHHGRH